MKKKPPTKKALTSAEIEAKYPNEWILLVHPALDKDLEVLSGVVVCHSKNRDDVYRKLADLKPDDSALMFTGRPAPGTTMIL